MFFRRFKHDSPVCQMLLNDLIHPINRCAFWRWPRKEGIMSISFGARSNNLFYETAYWRYLLEVISLKRWCWKTSRLAIFIWTVCTSGMDLTQMDLRQGDLSWMDRRMRIPSWMDWRIRNPIQKKTDQTLRVHVKKSQKLTFISNFIWRGI